MDAIKTVSLTKKYKDVTAVDELSLTVKEGELFLCSASTVREKPQLLKCFLALPSLQAVTLF